mmetsp:Transcript_26280/g.84497  ORF Transcript_26280/g.84497 Transcript_26280/m.84497 type:complete len:219 (+) Transcript_26280:99-755(+)
MSGCGVVSRLRGRGFSPARPRRRRGARCPRASRAGSASAFAAATQQSSSGARRSMLAPGSPARPRSTSKRTSSAGPPSGRCRAAALSPSSSRRRASMRRSLTSGATCSRSAALWRFRWTSSTAGTTHSPTSARQRATSASASRRITTFSRCSRRSRGSRRGPSSVAAALPTPEEAARPAPPQLREPPLLPGTVSELPRANRSGQQAHRKLGRRLSRPS